eukprot:261077_1
MPHIFKIIVQFLFHICGSYYANPNTLDWYTSELFCERHCNSHLLSIHNELQQQTAISSVMQDLINKYIFNYSLSYWIGLNDETNTETYQWIDSSATFIFNETYSDWAPQQPSNDFDNNCVALEEQYNYSWNDIACNHRHISFLCNSCNLKLNKYILVYDSAGMIWNDAQNKCRNEYKTDLASIHSENDQKDASILCQLHDTKCWIGLHSQHGNFPLCISLWSVTNSEWKITDECNSNMIYSLCNMPSLLCFREEWNIISGIWNWNDDVNYTCGQVYNINSNETNISIIWIGDTTGNILPIQVWNDIIIEYTFTILDLVSLTSKNSGGIIFRVQHVSNVYNNGEYYYACIIPSDNMVELGRIYNNQWTKFNTVSINESDYMEGIYYRLTVKAVNNIINVSVNDILYISYTINDSEHLSFGSIGLRNIGVSTISKSLYVSSATYMNYTMDELVTTQEPSIDPTMNPIVYFTLYPTLNPSKSPHVDAIVTEVIDIIETTEINDYIHIKGDTGEGWLTWFVLVIAALFICIVCIMCIYCNSLCDEPMDKGQTFQTNLQKYIPKKETNNELVDDDSECNEDLDEVEMMETIETNQANDTGIETVV